MRGGRADSSDALWQSFTEHERRIVKSLRLGLNSKEIARDLVVGEDGAPLTSRGVDYRIEEICKRANARNRAHLSYLATESEISERFLNFTEATEPAK